MKAHTSNFKEQIKLMGKEIDSRITFGDTVLGKNDLNAVTPSYQGAILKSVMKQLDIDSNVEIPLGTILKYEFGLKVNSEYEYINYGNYVVYSIEKQEDTGSYKIVCYDKLLYSMLDYVKLPITYPISVRDYINAISTTLGLKFANKSDTFANYDKQIQADLYDGIGYTFRDVLDELAQVTASTICLNDNDELEIRYITETGDTIDEEFLKDVNVNFGEKFGAVNTIVLSRSADSDSVYYPSELPENPYEFKISDNQIMNDNDRADFLPDIYEKLNGLEFYTNDFVSTGICYYDLCDRYSVKIGDNTYSCVMLNDEVLVTQGLEENVYTELPEQTETDYKHASKDDRAIKQAYIIAKKNESKLTALASDVSENASKVSTLEIESNNIKTEVKEKIGSDEVVSSINQSAEQITLKGNRVVIESDNFDLTADGTIKATAGQIAGFDISSEAFTYLLQAKKDYTEDDMTKLANYLYNDGTLTDEEKQLYDINNDGVLNLQDIMQIAWIIQNNIGKTYPGKFQIKVPKENELPLAVEVGIYDGEGKMLNGFGYNKLIANGQAVADNLKVSATQPTTKEKVWIQKSKNLYNDSFVKQLWNVSLNNGVFTQDETDTEPKPYIKLQKHLDNSYVSTISDVYFDSIPIGRISFSFTKDSSFNELLFGFNGATIDSLIRIKVGHLTNGKDYTFSVDILSKTQGSLSWKDIQIESGSTATEYEPYAEDKIYTKNGNGIYEEFNNGIVESGSNENGYWEKRSNGIMECFGTKTYPSATFSKVNNVYYRDLSGVTFPVPFKEGEIIVPTCSMSMGNVGSINAGDFSNTGIYSFTVLSASSGERAITVRWRAIGRWK